ncbi:MAG: carbohydrate binding family 9 domain-containing protein, partial [Verrucomicrobiota bacterium]
MKKLCFLWIAIVGWLGSGCLSAAEPSLQVVSIDGAERPKIDGDLSDAVWQRAALIPGLTQMAPIEQATPTERTEVRVCYDSENLYVAFRCWDSDIDNLNAAIMQRDQSVGSDDYVFILLDPYQTGREGFYFRVNANGAKGDGRVTAQTSRPNMDWDAIWDGDGTILEDGWSVEFAIPFRSVSFDPNSTAWKANFARWIPRKQERIRWAGAYRQRRFHKLENAGTLTGLQNMERGKGIDFKPYALGRRSTQRNTDDSYFSDYGADLFWQVTPSLTTTFT